MKRMEQKEAEKAKRDAEEEEERKRRVPLLNETSFDRRKVRRIPHVLAAALCCCSWPLLLARPNQGLTATSQPQIWLLVAPLHSLLLRCVLR